MHKIYVDEIASLANNRDEWDQLFGRAVRATPFQSYAWVDSWWKWFGASTLKSVALRSNGELIGIAPFFIYTDEKNVRKLCFIGSGISDFLGIVASPEYEVDCVRSVMQYVNDISSQWDECDLQEIREQSLLLDDAFPFSLEVQIEKQSICPYIVHDKPHIQIQKIFPDKMQRNIRNSINRIKRNGDFHLHVADESSLVNDLNDLFVLHGARWESKNETGVLNTPILQKFYNDVSFGLMKAGMLQLYKLVMNGITVASYYIMIHGTAAYVYISGFDPSMNYFSPGTAALFLCFEDLQSRGITRFDFMRGQEKYKYLWGARDSFNYQLKIGKRGLS